MLDISELKEFEVAHVFWTRNATVRGMRRIEQKFVTTTTTSTGVENSRSRRKHADFSSWRLLIGSLFSFEKISAETNGRIGSKVDYSANHRYSGSGGRRDWDRRDEREGDEDRNRHRQIYYNNSRKRQRTMSGSETGSEGAERGGGGRGGGARGGDLASKTLILVNSIFLKPLLFVICNL